MALQLKKYEPIPNLSVQGNNYQAGQINLPAPQAPASGSLIPVGGQTGYYKSPQYSSWSQPQVVHPVIPQTSAQNILNSPLANILRVGQSVITRNPLERRAAIADIPQGLAEINQRTHDPSFAANFAGTGIKPKVKLNGKQLNARKTGTASLLKKGMVDKDAVILNELRNVEKATGTKGDVNEFMYNSNMTRGSNAVANNVLQTSPNVKAAIGGLSKRDYRAFSDYANARTELSTAGPKVRTSTDVNNLRATVQAGYPQFGGRFDALNAHYKDLAQVAHKAGLIDKPTLERYTANNDYVRLQRDMGDLLPSNFGGKGYSLGKTVMSQKRTGSGRATLPAGETAANYTQQIYREAARNKTGLHLVDALTNAGLSKQLVNSEDVIARRAAYGKLAELKPARDALAKEAKNTSKQLKNLINRNKALGPNILSAIKSSAPEVRKNAVSLANDGKRAVNRPDSKRLSKGISEGDIHEAFQQYLDGNPALVRKIYEFLGNKTETARITKKLDDIKAEHQAVKQERGQAWLTAKQHADQMTKNKNTISVMRDGIKEVYEVSPQIKEAVQNINPYHMNAVMQILSIPGRTLRAGVTGLNPVFIARNLIKDQAGSAINSEHLLATHNPVSFFSGLWNASKGAAGHNNDPIWRNFIEHYGDQTSYDLTRNVKNTKQVVNAIRGGTAVKLGQHAKNPLRSLENVAQITEKSTRFQNFRGAYKKAIKDGLPAEQASERAAIQAWQNSVDFSRAGEWGRVINTVIPYWNPATQGVRQMGRTFAKHPIKSSFTGATILGVPLAAATAWNLQNEDTKKVYDNISENEKDNNLVLVPPGTKQNHDGTYDVIKVPLPPGYKDVFMPIRRALEAYHKDKPLEGRKIAQDILQATTGPIQTQTANQVFGSVTPQAVKPFVQQSANKDLFTGKQIVPDYMNATTDPNGNPVPEVKKAFKNSSGTATLVGQKINRSPIKLEKFVKDVGGTVGLNLLNASDRVLAAKGKIPKEQIGGQSLSTGFKKSFTSTQGIVNANRSEGAKYYDKLKSVQKAVGLNGNELSAFNSLHPSKKNFLGQQIYEADSTYNPAARLDIYNRYPKVFEADKKLDAQNQNHNPLYGLQFWQVKKVLEKDNLPPGAKDPELSNLYKQDWYHDYSAKKSAYFSAVADSAAKTGHPFGKQDNPYPATSASLQKTMDYYTSLPKGTGARSGWIKANPGAWQAMQDQFAKIDNWQNIQRGKRGLDYTQGVAGANAGYANSSSGSGSSNRYYAGSKKNPYYTPNPSAHNVSLHAGGSTAHPKVSVRGPQIAKSRPKTAAKPKVSLKKSRV